MTGELAVPFIQGVQQWDVAACVKHFAANNQETQRLWVDVEIDEKALREIYLPAFYDCLTRGKCLGNTAARASIFSMIFSEKSGDMMVLSYQTGAVFMIRSRLPCQD